HISCLQLKMLQPQPEREITKKFIQNDEYLTVLGAVYLRFLRRIL
ncbi:Pre-mRNA splicing factor, partial [Phytophthora megakarya]